MTYADGCLFCKFVKKEIEPAIVYEDEHVIAFLDINPAGILEGHTLVLPKKHAKDIFEVEEKELCEIIKAVKKISAAVKEISGAEGINIIQNNGKAAGQAMEHIHFHIIPRRMGDGIRLDENRRALKPLEATQVAKAIKEELNKKV
jgi:histidine triad (HIT) family protein